MKTTIKQALQTLNKHFGASIFSNPKQFKAALADVPIESDAKKIRNLLNIAICEMKAYSRLESSLSNKNNFVVDNLSEEMLSDFAIDKPTAQMVIESIAELLGYVPKSNIPIPTESYRHSQPIVKSSLVSNQVTTPISDSAGGIFTDPRDGQKYRTVKIGNQIWMAENLNYKTGNCWAYDNNESNRQKYGLLYHWKTAMNASPAGWHLPTREEWDELVRVAGGSEAEKNLKSKTGWYDKSNGTDKFGFSALPGGYRWLNGGFDDVGGYGLWWSATEHESGRAAYIRIMGSGVESVFEGRRHESCGCSVRCLQD